MTTSPNTQLFPPIATLKHFVDPTGSVAALDAVVDSMITGCTPRKPILLEGAVGTGKRHLARAIAREFGTTVFEFEPHSGMSRSEFAEILQSIRPGDVVVAHNLDEFAGPFLRDMVIAVISRRAPAAAEPTWWQDPAAAAARERRGEGASDMSRRLPEFEFIATTNSIGSVPGPILNASMKFALHSSQAGTEAGIARALRFNGVAFEPSAIEPLAAIVRAAQGEDMSETIVAMVCAWKARVSADRWLTLDDACKIAEAAWSFMPATSMTRSFAAALKRTHDVGQTIAALKIPPHLAAELAAPAGRAVNPDAESAALQQKLTRLLAQTPTPADDDDDEIEDAQEE